VAAYGVAGTKVLALLASGEGLADEKRLLLCGARAIALLAYAGFEWAVPEWAEAMARKPQVRTCLSAAVVLVALALWSGGVSAPLLVVAIAGLIIILAGLDI